MIVDYTIPLSSIIEILVFAVGGIVVFASLRTTVAAIKEDIIELKSDIKALNVVITQMAVADNRLNIIEMDLREMRHGRGFIRDSIQGEWPKYVKD